MRGRCSLRAEVKRIDEDADRDLRTLARASQAQRGAVAPPIQFSRIGDLVRDIRPVPWLVKRHLERGTTVCLFGDPESGKSLFALDLGLHIASGRPWLGNRVEAGSVFYLCPEGRDGLKRRARAWSIRHQVDLDPLPLYANTLATDLSDPVAALAVGEAVAALAAASGTTPQLVIVDTLSRHLGGDENSTADMARFVAHVDAMLREPTGACVLFVHHVGHGDKTRARGNSALRGAVDTEFRVCRDPDSGIATVECTKAKDWPRPEALHLAIRSVELGIEDEDGEPVTSAILDPTGAPAPALGGAAGGNQRLALAVLRKLLQDQRQRLEGMGHDPDGAHVLIDEWRDATKLDRRRWAEVRDGLVNQGLVVLEVPHARPV